VTETKTIIHGKQRNTSTCCLRKLFYEAMDSEDISQLFSEAPSKFALWLFRKHETFFNYFS